MPDGQLEQGSLLNDRYRILRVIGHGGMGTVYQAEHVHLNAILAVKEIHGVAATGTAQQTTLEQYEQEARILVQLNHPNLPKVTDAFVEAERFYLVMEFVEGVTLDARLRERAGKPVEPAAVVDWALQIADVLGYLHALKPPIIFRDLKPANVMVQPDGVIKLIDFGIARRFQPGASQDTALLGSVGYSPPEQFGKHQTDTRSDIYALGATMHHLLTAKDPSITPFKFVSIDKIALDAPLSLTRLVARCLAIDADQRPSDVGEVAAELRRVQDDLMHLPASARTAEHEPGAASARLPSQRINSGGTLRAGSGEYRIDPDGGAGPGDAKARLAAIGIAAVLLAGGAAFALHSVGKGGQHHPAAVAGQPHPHVAVADPPDTSGTAAPLSTPDTGAGPPGSEGGAPGSNDGGGRTSPPTIVETNPPPGSAPAAPPESKSADCKCEVVGASPDGKSIRLHVTGEIHGKKDMGGMVAAYFYNGDKTPLLARDPQGSYATRSGQLYAEFTFQIDADEKPIDGTLDVPLDQFTSMTNVQYQCVVYADTHPVGQTEIQPLTAETPAQPGSR